MEKNGRKLLFAGSGFMAVFIIWTMLIQTVDVQPVGQNGTNIGFAGLNQWFHKMTGVHMTLYTVTDWLGLVPIAVCMGFSVIGFIQLVRRKNLFKVDGDILLLGVFYILVIAGYLIFEMIPINYRPLLIEGRIEASYPSSTTLLVVSVMPTLAFQVQRRVKSNALNYAIYACTAVFTLFMVVGRTISGVHWLTDIIGALQLSAGLYLLYHGTVRLTEEHKWNSAKNYRP
ncbi:MAG: phosphatase PAP2 family protein [Ruminiclostridium sp.]|nr:phosphatase PAP2 family protein [Ruminococcus sp.]MBP3856622.1 phosphatase PAP2 family protein [Ruminiclostridium sp.]